MKVSTILAHAGDSIDKSRANVFLIFSEEPDLTGGPVIAAEVYINERTHGFIYPGETVHYRVAPWQKKRQPTIIRIVPTSPDHTADEAYRPLEIAHVFAAGQIYRRRLSFVSSNRGVMPSPAHEG